MKRDNISSNLRSVLREKIIYGKFPAGDRLNEVHLAREFDVSRTPLREALCGLVNERLVNEVPRRGFFVAPLSVDEIRELYPIRQILDPAALKMAGIPEKDAITRLRNLNGRIGNAKTPQRIVELDDQWHLLLIAGCKNGILLDMIRQTMARTLRYELAYMSQTKNVNVVTDEHEAIMNSLEKRHLADACKYLKQNMTSAESPLIEWVRGLEKNH